MPETLILRPGAATLAELEAIYREAPKLRLDPACRPAVERSAEAVRRAAEGEAAVYGVNTGFGKLASVRIPPGDTAALQRNLVRSHCCGVGPALPEPVVRLVLALKLMAPWYDVDRPGDLGFDPARLDYGAEDALLEAHRG